MKTIKRGLTLISNSSNGLTLLEMTLVLFIISLLLASVLSPLNSQIKLRHYQNTQDHMNTAMEALMGFALINGRLPCPALASLATGQADAGAEKQKAQGDCDKNYGVLPWLTLGLPETDAWGRRLTYAVTGLFADTTAAECDIKTNTASFGLCSAASLNVYDGRGGKVASNMPVVLVSHGANGDGAYLPSGQQLLLVEHDSHEQQNYAQHTTFIDSHLDNAAFDDIVVWLSPKILAYRMVQAGVLP